MSGTCDVCKQPSDDIRIRTDGGAYGPVDVQTCEACHAKEVSSVRAESKRFGFRLKIKSWSSLTTRGAYSEVRATETA